MENFHATLITFIGGLIVGGLLVWVLLPARRHHRKMEQQRNAAEEALKQYRMEVDQHFLRTADLVNDMTDAYRAVHEHLAKGARGLCSEQGKRLMMNKSMMTLDASFSHDHPTIQQPLDYAPSSQGTLSESFGLAGNFKPRNDNSSKEDRITPPRDYAEGCNDSGCSNDEETAKS